MTSFILFGHLARIARRTFSIKHNLITCLVIDDIGFVSNVSATQFLLVRLAGFLYIWESKNSKFGQFLRKILQRLTNLEKTIEFVKSYLSLLFFFLFIQTFTHSKKN